MGLKELDLKSVYKSSEDDVLMDFYVPCLSQAVQYDRLAGYFSSSAFSVVAEGLLGFVERRGRMRLICSPELQPDDIEILTKSPDELDSLASRRMIRAMEHADASDLHRDHLMVLAYMLSQGLLELKLAVPGGHLNDSPMTADSDGTGIFHEKVGILEDSQGNVVSFSGSINESARAWLENAEDFKVFRNWESEQKPYQEPDQRHFDALWNNTAEGVRVCSLPEAVRQDMLQRAPKELDISSLRAKYEVRRRGGVAEPPVPPVLYAYQKEAVQAWLDAGRRGVFEMATGTGKTFTALAGLKTVLSAGTPLFASIAVPQQHLASQWKKELGKFVPDVPTIEVDSTNPTWRSEVYRTMTSLNLTSSRAIVVLGTYASLSSTDFARLLEKASPKVTCLLIADEVHRSGAPQFRRCLHPRYELRLGLSATPSRWFDEQGTSFIQRYFGETVFEFPLRRALQEINPRTRRPFLVPFDYFPFHTLLTDAERHAYTRLTLQIRSALAASDGQLDEAVELLLFKRARLIKDAETKIEVLEGILDQLPAPTSHTIIYVTENQMEPVAAILRRRKLAYHRFTMEQGTRPSSAFDGSSERDFLLRKFADGTLPILLAIKCLDEGVDVPPARNLVLMASSSSPVEHIQRLGRVLRPYVGKDHASIYDILVDSGVSSDSLEGQYISSIEAKEHQRFREIAELARNGTYALSQLSSSST